MGFFTSVREKKMWFYAFLTFATIMLTLVLGQPLINLFENQDVQAIIFVMAMLLVLVTIITHGLKPQTKGKELFLLIGMSAVYLMFFLRLGLAERSHLIEYSVLTIFIYEALTERSRNKSPIKYIGIISFVMASGIGVLDECLQIFIPNRVFDVQDIIFNAMASSVAIIGSVILSFVRNRFRGSNTKSFDQ